MASNRLKLLLFVFCLFALTPLPAFAQAGSPLGGATPVEQPVRTPVNQAPAGVNPSQPAATPVPAVPEQQPAAGPNAQAPAPGLVPGIATPVGANVPQESPEPISLFAYLLIALAGVWFLAALAGIGRLLTRPQRGPYAVPLPAAERDRPFLSFLMPFGALITVGIIVCFFGILFLTLAHLNELYPLAIDLFVVCLVMLIATLAALRGSGQSGSAVH